MGNDQHALEVFKEAADRDSDGFHALAGIADIYLKHGNYEEADKWAKKSFKVNPRFIDPIAIQIVIRLIRREDEALVPLIRKIDQARHSYLREEIQKYLRTLRKTGYRKKLEANFIAARSRTTRAN
jgi:tetratricopeptide (TPR) repeat protein